MKPVDVTDDSYAEYNKESYKRNPKFKVGDYVRISKYKNIFAEGYVPNWSEEIFVIEKLKNTVPWTYVINDLNGEEIIGSFYEKELQKTNQKEFRMVKMLKGKGDKLYVKWRGYDNSFNSWIYKKDIYFSKPFKSRENIKLKLIFLIMQQKLILKILLMQIPQILH